MTEWAGCPLVCSNLPALREVAGDAALYFEPDRPDSLAGRLQAVLSDTALRADLIAKGNARLKEFSWQVAAEQTLDTWFRAAGRVRPRYQENCASKSIGAIGALDQIDPIDPVDTVDTVDPMTGSSR